MDLGLHAHVSSNPLCVLVCMCDRWRVLACVCMQAKATCELLSYVSRLYVRRDVTAERRKRLRELTEIFLQVRAEILLKVS